MIRVKVMMVGAVSCGKTTLCQRMNNDILRYRKTQTVVVNGTNIDTPGEYLEMRRMQKALIVTAADADIILFLQDATQNCSWYGPNMTSMFHCPVIGVVTKTDIATDQQIRNASELLRLSGTEIIFEVSSVTGEGIDELVEYLENFEPRR